MKKLCKKMLCSICAIALILGATTPAFAADAGTDFDPTETETSASASSIMPLANEAVIDRARITSQGVDWVQPAGYKSYRIWVQNDTDLEMKVTHSSGLITNQYFLAPREQRIIYVNNSAIPFAPHHLDFSTNTGYVAGFVSVRVSTEVQ